MGQSSLLTLVVGEEVPVNRRKISQKFSPAGVTSSFGALASFGRVFPQFFQKPQQCQPFVF